MTKPKRRSWLGRIFSLFISTFITLVVLELILRIFMPLYQTSILRAHQYDEELGIRLKPGIHLFETTDYQQEIRVNKLGTVNFQENFDGYESLVFTAGDSYTQGVGLPSDLSYPAQLDLRLNEDAQGFYQKKYGVVNLGLAAYGGEQSLLALKRWAGVVGKPKYILYLGCDNDYEDDVLFKSGYRHKHIVDGSPYWGPLVRPMQWLTNDLQIGVRIKVISGQLRRSQIGAANTGQGPSTAEQEKSIFERLKQYADENGATLVVSWSDRTPSYNWLKTWAGENSVRFADWRAREDSVKASLPELPTENTHSAAHHRGWVNRIIAEEYARQMQK